MAAVHLASARNGSLSPQVDSSAIPELVGSPDPVKAADPVRAGDPHDPVAAALSPQFPDTSAVQPRGQSLPNYASTSAAAKILNPDLSMFGYFIVAAGLSVTRILPAPKGIFLEGTAQVFRGDSGDVFTSSKRGDASVLGHLRAYRDITDQTNLDLGISYARGHNDLGSAFLTDLYGLDATLRWTPLRRTIYHNFVGRAEFVWSRRDQLPLTQRAFGFFTSGDYRLNRRWTVGGRFDRSGRARAANLIDDGFSGVLTYWPSQFSQVRGQYRFTHFAEGPDGNELLFQFIFVLGAHGAHPF